MAASRPNPDPAALGDQLTPLWPHVAGLDVGATSHFVAVPADRDEQPIREFGGDTPALLALAAWLRACGIEQVVMEATGVYWMPPFRVLEAEGFTVSLVDPRQARNVPGRKSDVFDCEWLRRLQTYGLLAPCFVPSAQVAELRGYWRWRGELVAACSQQILLLQKALDQMNLRLHRVVSDLSGVTGMRILRAIVAGETDPVALAAIEHPKVKASDAEIVAALTGHYRPELLFCLRQALATYDFHQGQLAELEGRIEACLGGFASHAERERPATRRRGKGRKNEPRFDLAAEVARVTGVDLTRIDGIDAVTAQTILAELGPDLSAFPTVKQFCSWLGLCPNNRVTGGRTKSRRTRKVTNRVAQALRLAAQALSRSQSALGAAYRRFKSRQGPAKAITTMAHKLARLVYFMLRDGEAYVDAGQAAEEERYRQRQQEWLLKQARTLGLAVLNPATGEVVS